LQGVDGEVVQVAAAAGRGLADVVVFDVLPHPFVGVQFRGVGRQVPQGEAAVGGLDEGFRGRGGTTG
jgi:hypothetical protein